VSSSTLPQRKNATISHSMNRYKDNEEHELKIKESNTDRSCNTHRRKVRYAYYFVKKPERHGMKDLCVDRKIILKWILNK
jgi:hypothetical protein